MLTPEQVGKMIGAARGKTCQVDAARRGSLKSFARCCCRSSHGSSMSHLQWATSQSGRNIPSSRLY